MQQAQRLLRWLCFIPVATNGQRQRLTHTVASSTANSSAMAPKRAITETENPYLDPDSPLSSPPTSLLASSPPPEAPPMPQLPSYLLEDAIDLQSTQAVHEHQTNGSAIPPRRSSQEWNDLHEAMNEPYGGVFVNVSELPAGEGTWDWLEDGVDDTHAQQIGFDSPAQVEVARLAGVFTQGPGPNAGPMTLWYPKPEYFNPPPGRLPLGFGHWVYHTTQDRTEAETNFAGSVRYGLVGNHHPQAREIWRIRQEFNAGQLTTEDSVDPTKSINVVWIPAVPDPDVANLGVDAHTGEEHDPSNLGVNNQTGDGTAFYQTRIIDGTKFTVDRTRAHAPLREIRKTYIVTKKGQWQQYPHLSSIDWDDRQSVEKVNKWREQAFKRNDWPLKRTREEIEQRGSYTDEEKEFLMDHIKEAEGKNPLIGNRRLTRRFNKKFPRLPRDETGISAVIERLKKEFAKYQGLNPARAKRGDNLRKLAKERKKRKREEKGEEELGEEELGEEEELGDEEDVEEDEPAAKRQKLDDDEESEQED